MIRAIIASTIVLGLAGLLATLAHRGYVERQQADSTYRLGNKLWGLGFRALGNRDVVTIARAHLRRLVDRSAESVNLAVLLPDCASGMYVDKVDGPKTVHVNSPVSRLYDTSA